MGFLFPFGRHVGVSETRSSTYEFIVDETFNKEWSAFDYGLSLDYTLAGRGFLNAFVHDRPLFSGPTCWCGRGQDYWRQILTICLYYAYVRNIQEIGIESSYEDWYISNVLVYRTSAGLRYAVNTVLYILVFRERSGITRGYGYYPKLGLVNAGLRILP